MPDGDVVTTGITSSINMTATTGQTLVIPVDLYIQCSLRAHMNGSTTLTYDAVNSSGPNNPVGVIIGATPVTIAKPAGWPADGSSCPNGSLTTLAGRTNVTIQAPATATNNANYSIVWASSDGDVNVSTGQSKLTISLAVHAPAPDTTPPVITPTITGTLGTNGWRTSATTVAWSVVDPDSAVTIDSGCGTTSITTETTGTTVSCQAHSAGGSASSSVTVKVDLSGPTAALSPSGTLGANGWFTSNVTVHASGTDTISGPVSCTADQVQTAETTGTFFNGSCTNAAGLTTAADPLSIKVDKTGPSAALSVSSGSMGSDGWYTSAVTLQTAGSDAVSGGVTCTADQTFSTDTAGVAVNGSCTNAAGIATSATPMNIKLDTSPPTAHLSVTSGTLGADNWYTSDVTIHASGADNVSDPTGCTADQTQTDDTSGHTFTAECVNDAGIHQSADPLTVKRDVTPPTAALQVVSGTLGDNGWYTSDVTVRTVGSDATSGVVCSADQTLTDETPGTIVTGYCTDGAGHRTDAHDLTIKIDKTAPAVSLSVTAGVSGTAPWYTSDVTIHTTGGDAGSGLASCSPDQYQTSDANGAPFTGECTDEAGLHTVSDAMLIYLDKTGPTAVLGASGTLGTDNWFTSDVVVTTSGEDSISGILFCTDDQHQNAETKGTSFDGYCVNGAGLQTDAQSLAVKVDKSAPTATLAVTQGTLGDNEWYTTAVTVQASGTDDISGIASCSPDTQLANDTTGTDVNGSCINGAGLEGDASPLTIKLDTSNPSAVLSPNGTLGSDGWYVDDVTISTRGEDNVSDPVSCTPDQFLLADTTGQTFNGSCVNSAGRRQDAVPLVLKRDATPPTAELVVTAGTPGAHGWYTSDVTVHVLGDDPTSGVSCTDDVHVTEETAGVVVTGACTNGAGLTTEADPLTIKLDKTGPSAALSVTAGTPGANGWYVSNVTIAASGSDTISGPVTCTDDQSQDEETSGTDFHGKCTNQAGLSADAAALTVKLDKSAPDVHLGTTAGDHGAHGWYTSNVTVHTFGSDPISSVTTCTDDQHQNTETTGVEFAGTCTNEAGLTSDPATLAVKLDKTAPSASLASAGTAGSNGWFISSVVITASGTDTVSYPVTCTNDQTQSAETKGTDFHGSCTNDAGLQTDAAPLTVKVDKTGPSANLGVTAGTLGANGWYTSDVTVATSGSDDVSSPVTCSPDATLTTSTAGTLVNGACTNAAGLATDAVPLNIKLDKTNPTAHLDAHGTLGSNGWYRSDVTVTTSGSDDVSTPVTCTDPQFLTSDTAGQEFDGECTNDAGRTQSADPLTVKRDVTPPTVHLEVVDGTQGSGGWYTSNVTVRTVGADALSAVTCTADQTLSSETVGTVLNGNCVDDAGNRTDAAPLNIKIDKSAPSAQLSVIGGTPGAGGWYVTDVTIRAAGSDAVSGPVQCTGDQTQSAETTGATFYGSCTNAAGLSTNAAPLTVKLDKTGPTASLAVTAGTLGNNGWYVTSATVSTSGHDAISDPTSCTADQQLLTDTVGTTVNGACTNSAGITTNASALTVKVDTTNPVVQVNGLAGSYLLGVTPMPSCSTTDVTSGVAVNATVSVPALPTVGTYSASCTGAVDKAGNAGSASQQFAVIFRWDGFLQPINDTAHQTGLLTSVFKAGSTVPVKLQIKRADGTVVQPARAPIWLTPVKGSSMSSPVDESVYAESPTSGDTYRYDSTGQQWIYNWSTKGLASGFFYRVGVTLDDGQTYYVNIGLR